MTHLWTHDAFDCLCIRLSFSHWLSLLFPLVLTVPSILSSLTVREYCPHGSSQAGQYAFQVGSPGPGEPAPEIRLPATDGSTFDLAAMRGKTVLLYFQEGLSCQPCWDQLKDIQSNIN